MRLERSIPTRLVARCSSSGDIVLDGRVSESAWQKAPPITNFTQSYPAPGAKPTDPTEVRVLYDDVALYVGIRMFDAHPDSIAAQLARRDASGIYSDWIHVIVDSYHDRRTAFRFTVNPKGVKKDVYTSNDGDEDVNWDAIWDVATRVDSLGWVAEFRIPLSQLRFASDNGRDHTWGFQVMRDVARRNERDSWSPWTPQSPGFVSRFGDLSGLTSIPSPRRLEVVPYVSTKLTRAPGDRANPFFRSTDTRPSAGADLKYGLSSGLTLTATVNPDFGQVEVDPSVINLSAFETFFPEKRPFFLEGSDALSFGEVALYNDYGSQRFFYSRRIGREPQRSVSGKFVDQPDATTSGPAKSPESRSVVAGISGMLSPRGESSRSHYDWLAKRDAGRAADELSGEPDQARFPRWGNRRWNDPDVDDAQALRSGVQGHSAVDGNACGRRLRARHAESKVHPERLSSGQQRHRQPEGDCVDAAQQHSLLPATRCLLPWIRFDQDRA